MPARSCITLVALRLTQLEVVAGPVNRFWFDGTSSNPCSRKGTGPGTVSDLWQQVYDTIRSVSPDTMITSYRGSNKAAFS